jgi:hypothetical protein
MYPKEKEPAMKESDQTVGQFVNSRIQALRRRVAKSGNAAGYAAIYPEVATELVESFPELSLVERQTVFGVFKSDAELTRVRTGINVSAGLGSASRILSSMPAPQPKPKLTLRPTGHVHRGPRISPTDPAFMYSVQAMPRGQEADIANFGGSNQAQWRILRRKYGVLGEWTGDYRTAEEALAALQKEL